jgi:hypothetical protein
MTLCPVCVQKADQLGEPSRARWVGPDGEVYCSLHFIHRFGHGEKLVRIDGYEAPTEIKPPAIRKGA